MSVILFALVVLDLLLIAAAYARHDAQLAYQVCQSLDPICAHPPALIIAGIILTGLFFGTRA